MTSPTPKGKEKEADAPETELTEAQRLKRSFERSLAGPSVGKAGLIRDQTGKSGFWKVWVLEAMLMNRDQSDHC